MSSERIQVILSAQDTATPQLKKFNAEIQKTQKTSQEMQTGSGAMGSIKGLGTAISGLGVAFAGSQVLQMVGDLNQLGTEAQGTSMIFQEMASEVGGADKLLNQLRTTTGNVVTDMDLMAGASSIMRMGLADSAEGVNDLIEMAVKLKKPTESASEAIENFTLMLSNQSVARLDSFGISSGKVRDRINELIESGQALNREQAFTMAVMEQGGSAIERLGDAANISETAMNRLGTRFENLKVQAAEFTATIAETGAQLLEIGVIGAEMTAEGQGKDFLTAVGLAIVAEIDPNEARRLEERIADKARQQLLDTQGFISTISAPRIPMGKGIMELMQSNTSSVMGNSDVQSFLAQKEADAQFTQFQSRFGEISNSSFMGRGNMGLMDEGAIATAIAGYEQLKSFADELKEDPLIRPENVTALDSMVDSAKQLANEAESARQAFESMSLSAMLGQTDGGRLGELGDMILGNVEDEDSRSAFAEAMNMASGRETELSNAVEDRFAPMVADIYEQYGEETAIAAAEGILRAIEEGQVAGLTDQQIISAAGLASGFSYTQGAGIPFDVMPGDTPFGIQGQTGISIEDIFAAAGGGGNQYIYPGSYMAGGGSSLERLPSSGVPPMLDEMNMFEESGLTQSITDSQTGLQQMEVTVQTISADVETMSLEAFNSTVTDGIILSEEMGMTLDEITAKDYSAEIKVKVKLEFDSPEAKKLLQSDMTQIANDNGGTIPE